MSIAELKLKQRLLRDQLSVVDQRADRAATLLHKRKVTKLLAARSAAEKLPGQKPARAVLRGAAESSLALPGKSSSDRLSGAAHPSGMVRKVGGAASGELLEMRQKHLAHHLQRANELQEKAARRPPPGPRKAGAFKKTAIPETLFTVRHARDELPCSIEHVSFGLQLTWVCPLNVLDYDHYLPMFVEGLCCTEHPFDFIARQGCHELLEEAQGSPERVVPTLPKVVPLVRQALCTKHPPIVFAGLQFLRELAQSGAGVGEALVPYYRLLLGILNLFVTKRKNLGDDFDYGQGKDSFENIGDSVLETLEILERTGGPTAFVNIKYMVPTYQSCINPF